MLNMFHKQSMQISELNLHLSIPILFAALTAVTVLFILDAYGWVLILRILGQRPSTLRAIRIWMISSIARYIPGGIWSYVSRAELARHENINLASLSISMWIETVIVASSSLAIGLPALMQASGLQYNLWHALGAFFFLSFSMHPRILALLRFMPGKIGLAFAKTELPSVTHIFIIYCYYTFFWFLFALSFVLFANMIFPLAINLWLPVGSSIALGFFVGFIILIVPSGIGVREATLYFLLTPHMTDAQALILAVSSRPWIMIGEIFSMLFTEILYWNFARKK